MYKHFKAGECQVTGSSTNDLYQYTLHVGMATIPTKTMNSYWYIDDDVVCSETGTGKYIISKKLCVEIFGYTPEKKTSSFNKGTDLPYINGCSTKQLIAPTRAGDPTWQLLYMPPYTTEQEHHIHSTTRVVYVHKGIGVSVIGQSNSCSEVELSEGDILILDKMVPHHFITGSTGLTVLPLHIFSSSNNEYDHPMFNGTFRSHDKFLNTK